MLGAQEKENIKLRSCFRASVSGSSGGNACCTGAWSGQALSHATDPSAGSGCKPAKATAQLACASGPGWEPQGVPNCASCSGAGLYEEKLPRLEGGGPARGSAGEQMLALGPL